MFWYRALPVVLLALVVSACGGGSAGSTARLVHAHGTIVRVGGPAPGSPVPIAGARFTVNGAGEGADVVADRHGRFAFDLAPGTYRITITGHAPMSGNAFIQPRHGTIVVRPGRPPVRLVVDIR